MGKKKTGVMKREIWEKFPQDLFEVVLARLPIANIIRFRTVCQQWNNLITSQRFYQQLNPLFYITFGTFGHYKYSRMYDPFMKRWNNSKTFEIPAHLVSSAGGLVCFGDSRYINPHLYVCNPMTQSLRKLPNGSIMSWHRLGMTMNGSASYRVLKLGNDREYEIYDSLTNCWSHLRKIPECIKELSFTISNIVSIDNTLYFKPEDPKRIISCDTSTRIWTQHLVQVPLHSSNLTLAESDGRIMLVGLVGENFFKWVCIWEVQKITFLLKEIDRKRIGFPVFDVTSVDFSCWGMKGFLSCYLKSGNMHHMITYNISTRKWENVPMPNELVCHSCIDGTAFQPCFSAMP